MGFRLNSRSIQPQRKSQDRRTPETVAEFVTQAFDAPIQPIAEDVPIKLKPRGIMAKLSTPEERSAYFRHLASLRKPENIRGKGRKPRTPHGWTKGTASAAWLQAQKDAEAMVLKLKAQGMIDPSDAEGEEATRLALAYVRMPGGSARRKAQAKRLLAYYQPEALGAFA